MNEGTYDHDSGWTFTAHRDTTATETWRTSWRSPDGQRGIIVARMTVEQVETFDPNADWARGVADFQARRAS